MADEGLHEIQLNGKQLVFLFMASTVVAVVIFLCGVMVGRGVRVQRPADAIEASVDASSGSDSRSRQPLEREPLTAATPSNTPIASQETLTYPNRLEGNEPAEETLTAAIREPGSEAAPKLVATPEVGRRPPGRHQDREPRTSRWRARPPDTCGTAYVWRACGERLRRAGRGGQRSARGGHDREAPRGKGYPSFVTTPPNGSRRCSACASASIRPRREAEIDRRPPRKRRSVQALDHPVVARFTCCIRWRR